MTTLPDTISTLLDTRSWTRWATQAALALHVEALDGVEDEDGFSLESAILAYQYAIDPVIYAAGGRAPHRAGQRTEDFGLHAHRRSR